jgi:hypothetical protein
MLGRTLTLAALAILSLSPVQDRAPSAGRAPGEATLTRSASAYQALELSLLQAVANRSRAELDRILSEDFEVWSAEKAGPLSRQDWETAALVARGREPRIRELTVREFDDLAIVSFLLDDGPVSGSTTTVFVVDIWNQSAKRLRVRYESTPARPVTAARRRE